MTWRPLGRPAVTLSALALGLAALAACGPSSPSAPHAHRKAGATARSTAAPPATSPAAGAAGPGGPGGHRVAVGVASATFISARTGWALEAWCRGNRCPRIAVRKTTDHGRHWFAVPAPPAPFAFAWYGGPPDAVSGIRFADPLDGWAFGPGLWATHDGGRTWHPIDLGGEPVRSLEAGGGWVIAAVANCVPAIPRCNGFTVDSSPVAQDQWQPLPGASATGSSFLTGPELTVAAGTGFMTGMTVPQSASYPGAPLLLTGPVDGSAPWHPLAVPCPRWTLSYALAATPGLALALACASEPGAGNQWKRAYLSPDDGQTWRRLKNPPVGGYLGALSITPSGTILLSGGRNDVYVSWDGGLSWHGTAATSPSLEQVYQGGGALGAAMTTDTQGFTVADSTNGQMWFTYDDAHTWQAVTVR